MTLTFENWTAYDEWLIKNYSEFQVYKITENEDKSIVIEYCTKDEYKERFGTM